MSIILTHQHTPLKRTFMKGAQIKNLKVQIKDVISVTKRNYIEIINRNKWKKKKKIRKEI